MDMYRYKIHGKCHFIRFRFRDATKDRFFLMHGRAGQFLSIEVEVVNQIISGERTRIE